VSFWTKVFVGLNGAGFAANSFVFVMKADGTALGFALIEASVLAALLVINH
jgi:hypothetical protein